jgi:hypothetical protein
MSYFVPWRRLLGIERTSKITARPLRELKLNNGRQVSSGSSAGD